MRERGSATAPGVRVLIASAVAVSALAAAAGCGGPGGDGDRREVLVFGAASLTDALERVEEALEAADPDLDVVLNLAGSSALRAQIEGGAPADVVATANRSVMDQLEAVGAVEDQQPFATNRLVLATAPGNPAGVSGLADLERSELFVGLCAAGVPCGDLADLVLTEAGVEAAVDSREPDVRALVTKLEAGELDVGLVYASDVVASPAGLGAISLPEDLPNATTYPVAVLRDAPERAGAERVVEFLLADEGRAILAELGFGTP
jgi:molybdate transport system substrate-binding protein